MAAETQAMTAAGLIRREIELRGAVSFHRFMQLALYAPGVGYYERASVGRGGDFFTSVSVGHLFGHLLAAQFAVWLEALSATGPIHLVEAGAHEGTLAADILGWFQQHQPALMDRLEYWILEPSFLRQSVQRLRLESSGKNIRWFSSWEEIPPRAVRGVIFSNELLDAFPVHRLGWDAVAGRWFEWGVTGNVGEFEWARLSDQSESWPAELEAAGFELPGGLLAVLPDQFTVELSPEAGRWWRQAARALGRGRLMTLDYGLERGQLLVPERPHGTLRAYRRHQVSDSLLAMPGEQDLTAHVNFEQIRRAGEDEGLATESICRQESFFGAILGRICRVPGGPGADFSAEEVRSFQTLTHPAHMGQAFSVTIQRH